MVAVPTVDHEAVAVQALERGLDVLVEKPMTLDKDQAWDLVRLARENSLHLMLPYGWHYKPFIQEAKRLIDQNVLGEVEYAMCHMASPTREFFAGSGGVGEMSADWARKGQTARKNTATILTMMCPEIIEFQGNSEST